LKQPKKTLKNKKMTNSAEKIPSNNSELLKKILGSRVSKMTRYSWYQSQEAAKEIAEEIAEGIGNIYDNPESSVFRRTTGALVISFESGLDVGFSSIDSLASISVWEDEHDDDDELFPIDACDPIYSEDSIRQQIGKKIVEISILKRKHESPLYFGLPCEAGLVLKFENNFELIMSHNLSDNNDFSVIFRSEIPSEMLEQIQEIPALVAV
jgi:hypothetical protein